MLEGSRDEWESWGWIAESPCFAAFTLGEEKRRGGLLWKGQDLREGGQKGKPLCVRTGGLCPKHGLLCKAAERHSSRIGRSERHLTLTGLQ